MTVISSHLHHLAPRCASSPRLLFLIRSANQQKYVFGGRRRLPQQQQHHHHHHQKHHRRGDRCPQSCFTTAQLSGRATTPLCARTSPRTVSSWYADVTTTDRLACYVGRMKFAPHDTCKHSSQTPESMLENIHSTHSYFVQLEGLKNKHQWWTPQKACYWLGIRVVQQSHS